MQDDIDLLIKTITDVWQHGLLGVDIGSILTAIGIFIGFMMVRGIFSRYILSYLHRWASKSTTKLDDKIVDALIPPIEFIPVILGLFFAAQSLEINDTAQEFFMRFERSLIAFAIFWALHRVISPLRHGIRTLEKLLTSAMMDWIFKTLRVLTIFIGGAVILEIWGIAVGPLLAGFGLLGAAVALGAQDLFKNLIGGITVIAEKRFYPGEWIKVDGVVEGIVEEIGFRSTKVRRFDKAPMHVPNAQLSDAALTNFTRMSHRRIKWAIGVEYKTSVEQLQIIRDGIMDYIVKNEAFASPDEVSTFVRIDSFNASSIDFLVYCFTKTTVWGEWLAIKEDFALAIKEIVEDKAGSAFAFPSQSIYIENLPEGDVPEAFVPPKG